MENKPKKMTLKERVERIERILDRHYTELFMASSMSFVDNSEVRETLKGRVGRLENLKR